VDSFCAKNKIKNPDMDTFYRLVGRDRRFFIKIKNLYHFRVEMFLSVLDRQLQELNNRFGEVNTELLRCMASFSPANSFAAFNVENLVKLARFYPHDFEFEEMYQLPFQLAHYINDVRNDESFTNLRGLAELSMMLVKKYKVERYNIVYKLLKLVLAQLHQPGLKGYFLP